MAISYHIATLLPRMVNTHLEPLQTERDAEVSDENMSTAISDASCSNGMTDNIAGAIYFSIYDSDDQVDASCQTEVTSSGEDKFVGVAVGQFHKRMLTANLYNILHNLSEEGSGDAEVHQCLDVALSLPATATSTVEGSKVDEAAVLEEMDNQTKLAPLVQ